MSVYLCYCRPCQQLCDVLITFIPLNTCFLYCTGIHKTAEYKVFKQPYKTSICLHFSVKNFTAFLLQSILAND